MPGRLRWGVLGTAAISAAVIPAIRRCPGSSVAAVASRSGEKARAWAARFGVPRAFAGYEELLAAGEVDVLYVPLPNSLHAEWTIRALERGIPVLCEKPLAHTAGDARRIAEAAARTGLPVAEGFMYRFLPVWERVRELLAADAIGPVSSIDAVFSFLLDDPASIVASARLGGGALQDVGCYAVDVARQLAGSEPSRVSAFARFGAVDETMAGVLDFPNGVLARFETSIANHERHRVEITGTTGSLVVRHPWLPLGDGPPLLLRRHGQPDEHPVPTAPGTGDVDPYLLEIAHFADVVRGRTKQRWPVEDAVRGAVVRDALAEAARSGRVVAL